MPQQRLHGLADKLAISDAWTGLADSSAVLADQVYPDYAMRISEARRSTLAVSILLIAGATAFPQGRDRDRQLPPSITKHADVVYASINGRDLPLDVYSPSTKPERPIPVIVWVHGGGWRGGSKSGIGRSLPILSRGYGLVSVEYRLSGEAIFPAAIGDVKAAFRWVRANASTYGFDPARIGAWGSSAGGHLVALLGTAHDVAEWDRIHEENAGVSSRPDAVCNWFGPSDFLRMNDFPSRIDHDAADSPESKFVGGPIQENQQKAQRANPVNYVTPDDPPMLHMHGELDRAVPFNQSELLHAALEKVGVDSTLYMVKSADHGFRNMVGDTPETLIDRVAEFFARTIGKP